MKRFYGILGVLLITSFAATQSRAQAGPPPVQGAPPAQAGQSDQDAQTQKDPNQGVARVSLINGDASTQRGDSGDWMAAALNGAVVTGDKVSTAGNAQMELQLDFANILRLSGNSEADIADLMHNHIQLQIAQGLISYTVLKGNEAEVEIDTPNVGVRPLREGSYRIQVNSANETVVIVRNGEVELSTPSGSTKVEKGEMVTVRGSGTDAEYKKEGATSKDDWDKWNEDRDRTEQGAQSWKHVNPYYTGANDLDNHGTWSEVPDYGQVWTPNDVDPDWAPYSAGNWVWEPYYGWTWVSSEPWGWAPYHYGRWFRYSDRWRWWPGPVYAGYQPIWAPAYVSFFGYGAGGFGLDFGFGFGFGNIGWLPIGPCDPFFPWWGWGGGFGFGAGFFGFHDFDRFRWGGRDWDDFHNRFPGARQPLSGRFNDRFSNFRQAGQDQHILRGISSVRADQFGHGVTTHIRGISPNDFNSAHGMRGSLPVVPTHQSLSATNRPVNPSTIHNNTATHFFGGKTSQTGLQRSSFNDQAGRIQQSLNGKNGNSNFQRGGSTGVGSGTGQIRQPVTSTRPLTGNNARPGGAPVSGNQGNKGTGTTNGFQRFNDSNQNSSNQNRGSVRNTQNDRPPASRSFEGQGGGQRVQQGQNPGGFQKFNNPPNQQPTQPRTQTGQPPVRPSYGGNSATNSRPPLNMNRPIINNNNRVPQYNGGYRPPSNNGSYRPPTPPPSRPSYGGGGGNGGYRPPSSPAPSRPSYGGGGGGGRPSGGGSSGGGSRSSGGGGGSSHGGGGGSGGGHHH